MDLWKDGCCLDGMWEGGVLVKRVILCDLGEGMGLGKWEVWSVSGGNVK